MRTYTATVQAADGGFFQVHDHNREMLEVRCAQIVERRGGGTYAIEEIPEQVALVEMVW